MATLTLTGQSATETITQTATLTDADFANILNAFRGIFGHPELTDQETFAKVCSVVVGQILEQAYAGMQAQAAASAASAVSAPVITPAS